MLQSPPMSTFHQQLWLIAHIETDSKEGMREDYGFGIHHAQKETRVIDC